MFNSNNAGKISKYILPLVLFFTCQSSWAQFSPLPYKFTSGQVRLDEGTAEQDYFIKITVREHTIDFQEVCTFTPFRLCFFNTVYPIEDSYTSTVRIARGSSSVGYRIRRGFFDGLYSSIKMECANCSGVYPNQYHTPSGTELSFTSAAIYGFGDLPSVVNLELQTTASIGGSISLASGTVIDKDLDLTVLVLSSSDSSVQARKDVRLRRGDTSVNYEISGLSKSVSVPSYRIKVQCNNCGLKGSTSSFPRLLASTRSHSDINFVIELGSAEFIPAVQYLLLSESNPE